MLDDKTITELREKITKSIKIEFPLIGTTGDLVIGNDSFYEFRYDFGGLNKELKKSHYYIEAEREFIHFTTLKNLFSIIRERALRLYCLHNEKDISEFEFAAKQLQYPFPNSKTVEMKKLNTFILSLTTTKNFSSDNHWKEFGEDNAGVALRLKFHNYELWRNFFLAKVDYTNTNYLIKTFDLVEELNQAKRYKIHIDFTIIPDLLCFHKKPKYSREEEVRLIYNGKNDNEWWLGSKQKTYLDANKKGKILQYYSLPFFSKETENEFINKPQITIEEVKLGQKIRDSSETISKLRSEFVSNHFPHVNFSL